MLFDLSFLNYTIIYIAHNCIHTNNFFNDSCRLQDKIKELNNIIRDDDRYDGSILSDIDPDLNILFNMNNAINNPSKYFDRHMFLCPFNKYKNNCSILNTNIRGTVTNIDTLKFILDDLE